MDHTTDFYGRKLGLYVRSYDTAHIVDGTLTGVEGGNVHWSGFEGALTGILLAGETIHRRPFEGADPVAIRFDDCDRYIIKAVRRVRKGREPEACDRYVFPPVNGTPTVMGGVTAGVVNQSLPVEVTSANVGIPERPPEPKFDRRDVFRTTAWAYTDDADPTYLRLKKGSHVAYHLHVEGVEARTVGDLTKLEKTAIALMLDVWLDNASGVLDVCDDGAVIGGDAMTVKVGQLRRVGGAK